VNICQCETFHSSQLSLPTWMGLKMGSNFLC